MIVDMEAVEVLDKKNNQKIWNKIDGAGEIISFEQISEQNPEQTVRIRINWPQFGGTFSWRFVHSLQRACAVLKETPDEIIA